jgi:hypothetical protein
MSAIFQFGVTTVRLSKAEAAKADAICLEEGGLGFVGPVTIPGSRARGWFEGRNLGEPFDGELKTRVLERCAAAGLRLTP